mmetsp:Transcript_28536/g.47229  ORF Transcript_28536/g.47229 Transcript_28536/m.47229 type:complete len:872 (+) Transcript_28536:251-2866(+)
MNGHLMTTPNVDNDDDTFFGDGASTLASISMAIAEDGSCPRHPHVMLKEVGPDGYVYQKESCPACDTEFQTQKLALKDRKKELDRQLKQLDGSTNDINPNLPAAAAAGEDEPSVVLADDIDNLRDNLMQHASSDRRSMTDEEVNHRAVPPPPTNSSYRGGVQQQQQQAAPSNNNNNYPHHSNNMMGESDQGYSRPPLTLESLANQMNMMQQMQDWILRQKETEMNLLRTKVEAQQKELLSKEVELALLREKLDQQEIRMQQELKLLKLAAQQEYNNNANNRRYSSSKHSSNKASKEIHIQELHVSVGGNTNLNDANGDLDPAKVQAATQAATTVALENAAAVANHHHQQKTMEGTTVSQKRITTAGGNSNSNNNKVDPPPPTTAEKPPPSSPPKTRNRVVPLSAASSSAAPARNTAQPSSSLKSSTKTEKTANNSNNSTTPKDDKKKEKNSSSAPPLMAAAAVGGTAAVLVVATNNDESQEQPQEFTYVPSPDREADKKEFTYVPSPVTENKKEFSHQESNDESVDTEEQDTFDASPSPGQKATPHQYGTQNKRGPLLSQPPSNPNPNRKEPLDASTRSLQQPGGGGRQNTNQLNAGPTGLPSHNQVGDPIRGIPRNLDVDGEAPPTVPLEEDVTIGTYDQRAFETSRYHNDMDERSVGNMSYGNTVASSTYGEDRQKVVSQTLLDPYGDKGRYSGVVLRSTGMPHGLGRMVYEDDGRTYEGDWRHGRWHGYGRATFANGDSYEGEYRFDQRHGRGKYCWSDGRIYDGEFSEDKRHGKGTFQWPDGATYEGDFHQGQREGHGRYTFSDGGYYTGSWIDGRYEGFGECHWEDGRKYKGEWRAGMAHGQGVETYPDGRIRHDGQWIDDEPIRK